MTTIDRAFLKRFRAEADAALATLAANHGIKISLGNASFARDGSAATFKLELVAPNANGEMLDKPAKDFQRYARSFGLEPSDLNREFTVNGEWYRLVGCKPRSFKWPLIGERVSDGKGFKFQSQQVQTGLGR